MPLLAIPIDGLTVPDRWTVGPIEFVPLEVAMTEIRPARVHDAFAEQFDAEVEKRKITTLALIDADEIRAAVDLVAQAVDVLRVFQHVRYWDSKLTLFGLAGEVRTGFLPFTRIGEDHASTGFIHLGENLGWTFGTDTDWISASAFRWAGESIGDPHRTEAQRRALVGLQLLSQAIVEPRATFKMVATVTALESLLLKRERFGQTFRLARHVAFFGCGRQADDLCGRARDTCPYLELNPAHAKSRKKLERLQVAGASPPWLCSEWHRVVDWYDIRSDILHGSADDVTEEAASSALYWVIRYLLEPILEWLSRPENADHPVIELEGEINALPLGPDWEQSLGPLPSPP